MTEWEWYKDPYVKGLFIHLLLLANFKDAKFKGKVIKRGQLVTSIRSLSDALGYSDKTVQRCLDKLKQTKEIKVKATNRYTIITVVNYERYQTVVPGTTQGTTQSTTQDTTQSTNDRRNNKNSSFGEDKPLPKREERRGRPVLHFDDK